jgi:hypothetical protein
MTVAPEDFAISTVPSELSESITRTSSANETEAIASQIFADSFFAIMTAEIFISEF